MDSDIAIRAEGLGKKYLIGHQSTERGTTLRDTIARGASEFARIGKAMLRGQQIVAGDELEEFWALRDLDFEIKRGDVVGVIGRNGAGKSTLLKVLSRITEPTEGRVQINGRVASLLEVGTGFHPELSGRENIYLNGAILGMTRAEIRRKFDEIVAFSEVEKFLDTPVKRYSSGMYVRLAFAVAAHLEPEILIVDEVLAVGDAEFQKKCLGKMQDVAGEGRTVIFVSHNTAAIASLTRTAFFLDSGCLVAVGASEEILQRYLTAGQAQNGNFIRHDPPPDTPHVEFAVLETVGGGLVMESGETLILRFGVRFPDRQPRPCFSFQLCNSREIPVIHEFVYAPQLSEIEPGLLIATCEFPSLALNVGDYYLRTFLSEPPGGDTWEVLDRLCSLKVVRTDVNPYWGWRSDACTYFPPANWILEGA